MPIRHPAQARRIISAQRSIHSRWSSIAAQHEPYLGGHTCMLNLSEELLEERAVNGPAWLLASINQTVPSPTPFGSPTSNRAKCRWRSTNIWRAIATSLPFAGIARQSAHQSSARNMSRDCRHDPALFLFAAAVPLPKTSDFPLCRNNQGMPMRHPAQARRIIQSAVIQNLVSCSVHCLRSGAAQSCALVSFPLSDDVSVTIAPELPPPSCWKPGHASSLSWLPQLS